VPGSYQQSQNRVTSPTASRPLRQRGGRARARGDHARAPSSSAARTSTEDPCLVAQELAAPGKGIRAVDESTPTDGGMGVKPGPIPPALRTVDKGVAVEPGPVPPALRTVGRGTAGKQGPVPAALQTMDRAVAAEPGPVPPALR
jgi:hypothetical protein